jgi:hypothetical protein
VALIGASYRACASRKCIVTGIDPHPQCIRIIHALFRVRWHHSLLYRDGVVSEVRKMAASGPKMMKKPTYHRMKNIWLVVRFKETISCGTSAIPQKGFIVYRKQLLHDLIELLSKL